MSIHNWFRNRRYQESKAGKGDTTKSKKTHVKRTTEQEGKDVTDLTKRSWKPGDLELPIIEDEDYVSSKQLLDRELRKPKPRMTLVSELMADTSLAREKELQRYSMEFRVEKILEKWPALSRTDEVRKPFTAQKQ